MNVNQKENAVSPPTTAPPEPRPTAIEPRRVMVLDEQEQHQLIEALDYYTRQWSIVGVEDYLGDRNRMSRLRERVAHGEEYDDPAAEAAALYRTRARLATERSRLWQRFQGLVDPVLEQMQDGGTTLIRLPDGSARIERDETIRLAYADPEWDSNEKAVAKERAGEVFKALAGDPDFGALAHMLKQEWNQRSVEAMFREAYKQARDAEREKPEHERRPLDPQSFLPEGIRGLYRLVVDPRLKITAT